MEQQTDDNKTDVQPTDTQNAPEPVEQKTTQQNNVEIEKVSEQLKDMNKQLTEKIDNIYSMQKQIKDTNNKGGEPNGETDEIFY